MKKKHKNHNIELFFTSTLFVGAMLFIMGIIAKYISSPHYINSLFYNIVILILLSICFIDVVVFYRRFLR